MAPDPPPPAVATSPAQASALQATLFDFAIGELVRRHRESFPPLWTRESWARLLIWLALNCGCSGDTASLGTFAAALGPALGARLRRHFFSRELEDLGLQVLADPAEAQVLVLPLGAAADRSAPAPERVAEALERVGLTDRVVEPQQWQALEALTAIAWRTEPGEAAAEDPCG